MKRRKFKDVRKSKLKHQIVDGNGSKKDSNLIHDTGKCSCGLENVFPEYLPWYLFVLIVCVRIYYVLQPRNWWLLHPDEIFQSVEVAFSEIYGYGFRTYEYCPPLINITTPVEQQEDKQGMYSLRSFIYPQFFAAIFAVCKYLGLTSNGYLVGRIIQSIVTSFTTVAVFRISKTMFTCRGIAFLSAILTTCSLHLSVLGTHTLINSFISPFLFISLDFILKQIITSPDNGRNCEAADSLDIQENATSFPSKDYTKNNGYAINGDACDINSNHKVITESNPVNSNVGNVSISKRNNPNGQSLALCVNVIKLISSGFMLAILCYTRPDTFIFLAILGLCFVIAFYNLIPLIKLFYLSATLGGGLIIGVIVGGAIDSYTYGSWFLSPLQWYRLNAASHIPSILYGSQSPYQYIFDIFASCKTDMWLNVFFCIALTLTITRSQNMDARDRKSIFSLVITSFFILMVYSIIGHKEIRFVHNILVVINILNAFALHATLQHVNNFLNLARENIQAAILLFSVLFAINSFINFPQYQKNINLPWNTVTPSDSSDINQCLHFIGQSNNVTGVFLDGSIYMTAGYSILNHDVPLITLIHHEYHEYRPGGYQPRSDLPYKSPNNIRVINRYSDIIDVTNIHYLLKRLLESHEYNVIVVGKKRAKSFHNIGFNKKLFTAGQFSVLQRELWQEKKRKLLETGINMPIGLNATILEYEASWLYTAGLYNKAVDRLERTIDLSDKRIRPFQILGASYANLDDYTKAKETEDRCISIHGPSACRQPQSRIVIHDEYNAFSVN